ncbi:hypothetical protein C8R43DRAFT_1203470 [Mycena crocata]|nr:hypothetical protein C8R43DRAFT_1203470 [Mycena crocata]
MNAPGYRKPSVNPMDARFESRAIAAYARDTEVRKTLFFALDVESIFRVERLGLFWYLTYLKNGLGIAPLEVPSSGYMFGRGVYFADIVSKIVPVLGLTLVKLRTNYTFPVFQLLSFGPEQQHWPASPVGGRRGDLLGAADQHPSLLQPLILWVENYDAEAECAKALKRSTKGLGWTDTGAQLQSDAFRGFMMPVGPKRLRTDQPTLNHHEYIVNNLNQIRLRRWTKGRFGIPS